MIIEFEYMFKFIENDLILGVLQILISKKVTEI